MSSKKASKNGFISYCFAQQKNDSSLAGLSLDQLVKRCSPRWQALSASQKEIFRESGQVYSRPTEESVKEFDDIRDSYGRSLSALEKYRRDEALKEEEMKRDIRLTVDMNINCGKLESKAFYLLSTQVFCITGEDTVVPAELCLAKMSLAEGVIDTYHVFIDPGIIPRGYRSDCMANSKATHRIPLDFRYFEKDYNKIVDDLMKLLVSENSSLIPPVYCLPKMFNQNQMVIKWLFDKSEGSRMKSDCIKMYSLPQLLFEICSEEPNRSVDTSFTSGSGHNSLPVVRNRVPTVTIADAQLDRDTFMYMPGMYCDWHQEQETIYCAKATVLGWSYIMFSLVNPLYGIVMTPGRHMPEGVDLPNFSLGSCRSSMASSSRFSTSSEDTCSIRSGSLVGEPIKRGSRMIQDNKLSKLTNLLAQTKVSKDDVSNNNQTRMSWLPRADIGYVYPSPQD